MNHTNPRAFWNLLNVLKHDGFTENKPLTLGNVDFWVENDSWCYSLPVANWDIQKIVADLVPKLIPRVPSMYLEVNQQNINQSQSVLH